MRYFEDYAVGEIRTVGRHTLGRDEVVDFARRWDPQPFHLDERAAAAAGLGTITASGAHLLALTIRLMMASDAAGAVIAAVGWDELRYPHPARVGDTLALTVECVLARPSRRDPARGVVRNRFVLAREDGAPVFTATDTILVHRRATD